MTKKARVLLKRKTHKKKTHKKIIFWSDISNLLKNNKLNIIQKIHDERRDKIFKILNNIYNDLKTRFIFEYNISDYVNLFRKYKSTDNDNIDIYNMKPFIIYNRKREKIMECNLGGFGTKINSDIDIDFIFNIFNNEAEYIYKTIHKHINGANIITPFGTQFDTNFYFSFDNPFNKIVIKKPENFINYFSVLYCKITSRESIKNIDFDIYNRIDITKEQFNIIKNYYTITKNINKESIIERENLLFNLYSNQFEICYKKYMISKLDNLDYLKYHLFLPNSYIFKLSVYFAINRKKKINDILNLYNKIDKNIILYLTTLENLFECYYNNKPKYLLRALYSLSKINKSKELLLDENLITVINDFLQSQKDRNKKSIPYCVTDAIITDLLDFGDCSNKIKCNIIKDIKKTNNLYDIDYCKKSKNINYKSVIRNIIKIVFDSIKAITSEYNEIIDKLSELINLI